MERSGAIRFRLRETREKRGLTQQDGADLMGITRDYYQQNGIRNPLSESVLCARVLSFSGSLGERGDHRRR